MDAAQTNIKKIAFFLATALLLTAPFQASAQPTLGVSTTTVAIGSSAGNYFQNVTVTSSDGSALAFTAYIQYDSGNVYGNWLFTDVSGSGTTSTSTPFAANTTQSGVKLTIGLNTEIGAATPKATVVLTPVGGGAATDITVYYAQNTSCGGNTGSTSNGFISITPGNISLTAPTNGSQSQTVTIQDTTGSGMTFGYSLSPTGSWLSVSALSNSISANGTAALNVTANATLTAGAASYNGILTITPQTGFGTALNIPVVFTVTNGTTTCTNCGNGSGTLTINGATSNTYTTAFNYIAPNTPGGQCIPLQDTASGASNYLSQVSTTNGGNWLLANNQLSVVTQQLLAPSYGACVELTLSSVASTLASGSYQGAVGITSSSGATATINVNLYVSAGLAPGITVTSPATGPIYVFPNVAVNSSVVQQEVFAITAASGYILGNPSLNNGSNGFSMTSPVASNNTETFTITANSTGLTAGIYSTTVTISSSYGSSSSNTTTLTIVLPVGQGATTTTTGTTVIAPPSLAFQQQSGNSFWTSGKEAQAVTFTGSQGSQWSAAVVYASGSNWLNFDSGSSGTFGSGPATLLVDLFNGVGSLSPSATPYTATVSVTTPSGTYYVSVSLLVTASNIPVLLATPASATFAATTGSSTSTQSVTVLGSDNTASTTSPPIIVGTPTQSWVTATASGNTMTIGVNSTGQATGVYSATIPVSANAYSSAINYPVVMVVNGGGGGGNSGPLTLSTSTMPFTNVTAAVSEYLYVTASSSTNFTVVSSETNCLGTTWLQVTSGTFTASTTATALNVQVTPSGIANGTTCNGVITLVSSSATQTVSVSMTVGNSTGSGNVTVNPASMSFAYTQTQSVPAAQTATIVNAVSGTASIAFTVRTSATWIATNNVTSASTPYNSPGLSVSVVPGSMSPGTYNGTVTITPTGGTAVTISVALTITGSAVVSATPTSLNLSYIVGGTAPTGTISITGGGASAGFTASVNTNASSWLQISATSGTTPNTGTFNLTASIVSSALSSLTPGGSPYTGTISIAAVSPATGTTNVQVTLTVTAPLPAITGVTNAASGATGPIAPGEIISIYGTAANPIGPATSVALNSTTCPSPCTQVPTQMGGVQVKFSPGGASAPLLFVDGEQINAIVPYSVAGIASLSVEVLYLGQTSNLFPVTLSPTAPGIFTANGSGTGQAAVYQYDIQGNGSYNVPSSPAKAGWTLLLYVTGEGQVSPNVNSGAVTSTTPPFPKPIVQPTVLIGGQPATVSFYGEAPGFVAGLLQLNVVVPPGAGTGSQLVSVSMGSGSSQASVTVSLQ